VRRAAGDAAGSTLGVFTVDFSLDRLAGALEELQVSPTDACSWPRARARC
jgi:hypothetical protein